MITQLLATLIAFALVYGLLRLRRLILADGKNRQRYHRAYLMQLAADDLPVSESEPAVEWPTEIEPPADYATSVQESRPKVAP